MFSKGVKVHTHDGKTHTIRKAGKFNRGMGRITEASGMRGFVRVALVDSDGTEHPGDIYENVITVVGHKAIVSNFCMIDSSLSSVTASHLSVLMAPRCWAIGSHSEAATSNFSTIATLNTEWGTASNSASNNTDAGRLVLNSASQYLSGTWTLQQVASYAATSISNNVVLNAIGQCYAVSVGKGSLLSLATFASSSKSTSQALNVTYNFVFSAVLAYALFGAIIKVAMQSQGFFGGLMGIAKVAGIV